MYKLPFSLVNMTTSSNFHRILLTGRLIAQKVSHVDKFVHLPFGIGIIVPVNMPFGVKVCLRIAMNKIAI